MLRPIWKILPFFIIQSWALKNCQYVKIGRDNYIQVFDDVLIKVNNTPTLRMRST